jgi:hypothetical protein
MNDLFDAKWGVSQTDLPQLLWDAQSIFSDDDSSSTHPAITDGWKKGSWGNSRLRAPGAFPDLPIHLGNFREVS